MNALTKCVIFLTLGGLTAYLIYRVVTNGSVLTNFNAVRRINKVSFDRKGYVEVSNPFRGRSGLEFEVSFSLKIYSEGMVCMVGEPSDKQNPTRSFVTMWVTRSGAISVVANAPSGTLRMICEYMPVLNTGKWHAIKLNRAINEWTLAVDDKIVTGQTENDFETTPSDKLYLGGRDIGPNEITSIKGCIKNFAINGDLVTTFRYIGSVSNRCPKSNI